MDLLVLTCGRSKIYGGGLTKERQKETMMKHTVSCDDKKKLCPNTLSTTSVICVFF